MNFWEYDILYLLIHFRLKQSDITIKITITADINMQAFRFYMEFVVESF